MIKSTNLSMAFLYDKKLRENAKREYQLTLRNVETIKKIHRKKVSYEDFPEAYDYVDSIFPDCNVKSIEIYKVAFADMVRMGYGECEGFYDTISKIVVLSSHGKREIYDTKYTIQSKITPDETIVHELCHYCYYALGKRSVSREILEEFAYGWSIGYLKKKGYSDEEIIKNNFFPYLVGLAFEPATLKVFAEEGITNREYEQYSDYKKRELNKLYRGRVFKIAKEIAMEQGYKLIKLYSCQKDIEIRESDGESSRFDFMDI